MGNYSWLLNWVAVTGGQGLVLLKNATFLMLPAAVK